MADSLPRVTMAGALLIAGLIVVVGAKGRRRRARWNHDEAKSPRENDRRALAPPSSPRETVTEQFEVFVATDRFKFNAAHFIAYKGFRERLHGHNYSVSLRMVGERTVGVDGYLLDFGEIKAIVTGICKEMNEHFLFPCRSDVMRVVGASSEARDDEDPDRNNKVLEFMCEDGSSFRFPAGDVLHLPIHHTSAEEIAWYLWNRVVRAFGVAKLRGRGISRVEVTVSEAPTQSATYRRSIADVREEAERDVGPLVEPNFSIIFPRRDDRTGCGCAGWGG